MATFNSREEAFNEEARLKGEGKNAVLTQTRRGWDVQEVPAEDYGAYVEAARNPPPRMPSGQYEQGKGVSLEDALAEADSQFDGEASPSDARAVLSHEPSTNEAPTGDAKLEQLQLKAQRERAKADLESARQERRDARPPGKSPGEIVDTINKFTRVRTNPDNMKLYVGTGGGDNMKYYDTNGLKQMTAPGGQGGGLSHLRALTDPAQIRANAPSMDLSRLRGGATKGTPEQRSPLMNVATSSHQGMGKQSPLASAAVRSHQGSGNKPSPLAEASLRAHGAIGGSPIGSIATRAIGVSGTAKPHIAGLALGSVPRIGLSNPTGGLHGHQTGIRKPSAGIHSPVTPLVFPTTGLYTPKVVIRSPHTQNQPAKKQPTFYKRKIKSLKKGRT